MGIECRLSNPSNPPRRCHLVRLGVLKRSLVALAVLLVLPLVTSSHWMSAPAIAEGGLTPFSALRPGDLPADGPWRHQTIGKIKPNTATIIGSEGTDRFLVVSSNASASAWAHAVPAAVARSEKLQWQWSIQGKPNRSGLGNKQDDDFAARVYVVFDYPLDKLSFTQRVGIRLARSIYGDVPAAAISYVWLPGARTDTLADSPYTDRVKMIVASGDQPDSGWQSVVRNVKVDFQRAFGEEFGPGMPPLEAIIVTADTDQSGGAVRASFARLRLRPE